jgi:hypothetical protein
VPPVEYSQRFVKFITASVTGVTDAEKANSGLDTEKANSQQLREKQE